MEHLGAETQSILTVKQSLYVQGIGAVISRGSWTPLEKEGNALPFDHEFVWSRREDAVIGALAASRDARGRGHYPLVAVCHARGHRLGAITRPVLTEIKASIPRLQATQSRDIAKRLVQGIQGRFRKLNEETAAEGSPPEPATVTTEKERRAFLDAQEMGPERQGFYRILHFIFAATAYGKQEARFQLRLPIIAGLEEDHIFELWRTLLQTTLGRDTLILLVRSPTGELIDIIVGPPRRESFFSLRAGRQAIAFTHEAPYSISEQTQTSADTVFEHFLAGKLPEDPNASKLTRFLKRLRSSE